MLRVIGTRVRAQRTRLALTVRELAERADLSVRFVSQLEAGEANIAIGRLAQVARALEMSLEELVRADGEVERAGGLALHGPRAAIESLLDGRSDAELAGCLRVLELALGDQRPVAITLLGLRGAGKSTIGPRIAGQLELEFVELDERIQALAGLSLTEIFAVHGEPYYRRLEGRALSAVLGESAASRGCVIELPGGIVNNEAAYAFARAHTTTVWLKADADDHWNRVLEQGDRRPMQDRTDARAELTAILAEREPLYHQAEITVDTSRFRSVKAVARAVLNALRKAGWVKTR